MKRFKKIMSVLLTAIMVIAMCVPVMADGGTHKIIAPLTSHQYEIYQIFKGDYSDSKLINVKWGSNGTGNAGEAVSEDVLNALKAQKDKSDTEILKVVKTYANLTTEPVSTVSNGSSYNAVSGYYLIKDKDASKYTKPEVNPVSGTETYTLYIVKVVGADVTITPKAAAPSFEKKIKDTNDTTGDTSGWQDSADYDIGDQIPFQLKGTVASNYDDYKTYYFAFHDQEEKVKVTGTDGSESEVPVLRFNANSVKVAVDGQELSKDQYSLVTNPTDGCTFEVVFNNLKSINSVKKNSVITVNYTSELTENANIGNQGNINKAKLEFSNNPNNEQVGKPGQPGETPWDNVIVFTYQVVVNKYANSVSDTNKLPGAEFTLSKKLKDGSTKYIAVVKSTDGTSFTFKGLDDGDYILTETTTPGGYNTIDPIEFTVEANHTITWDGNNRTGVLTSLTGTAATGNITFTANEDKSELATDVVNKSGSTLPETGGIGTTIFYVVGVILMLGAGVLLVTKKRMSSNR